MKNIGRIRKTTFFKVLVIFFVLFLLIGTLDYYGSSDSPSEYPDYEMVDLNEVLDIEKVYKGEIDEKSQEILYLQTGLGWDGIQSLRNECDTTARLLLELEKYQRQLFYGRNETQIIRLEDGDVLVSISQRFCFYPHGHAAIVIDGEENKILEAKSYQAGSCVGTTKKWSNIGSFVVLRLKDEVVYEYEAKEQENPAESAANYAAQNLEGLKYSLLKDIRPLSDATPEYTQCAHLVWYAYYACGLDIDENRGFIIKPKDFLKSDVFEVVQVFGISPERLWEIRDE